MRISKHILKELCKFNKKTKLKIIFLFTLLFICFYISFLTLAQINISSENANLKSESSHSNEEKYTPEDIRFAQAHMKIAVRAFNSGNIQKAKEEIQMILERVPTFAEARFLKAVICAREKDFIQAWKNIDIAEKYSPNNPKIKNFINKLQAAYPRPANLDEITDMQRKTPQILAQAVLYSLEQFLSNNTIKSAFDSLEFTNSNKELNSKDITFKIILNYEKIKQEQIIELAKKYFSNQYLQHDLIEILSKDNKYFLLVKFNSTSLEISNSKAQPVEEALDILIKSIAEEVDLAIQESAETESENQNIILSQYSFIASDIKNIVDFIDKLYIYIQTFSIDTLQTAVFNNKNVIKGKLLINFVIKNK